MANEKPWTIQLFGGLRLTGPDTEVRHFPTRRAALLLARLALSRSGEIGRDDLCTILWPDDYLDATKVRLRQEIKRLKSALGSAGELISADRNWVRLDLGQTIVDAREFDHFLTLTKNVDDRIQTESRNRALEIYTGPLLPEQTEDWVQAERQEFHLKHLSALIGQAEALLIGGEAQESLSFALKAVRFDPYHEPARRAAMLAFAELGDMRGALRQFGECEKALTREFAAQPSESLRQLALDLSKRQSAPVRDEATLERPTPSRGEAAALPLYLDRIVGRREEARHLRKWFTETPRTRLAVITGPGGVGKTRLAVSAAEELGPSFGGRVFFAGLADLEPGQHVAEKVHESAGLQNASSIEEFVAQLGKAACLILIDNAEHVLEDTRQMVAKLLRMHPDLCILATSRQKLGIAGEQELPLLPLDLPEASANEIDLEASPAAQLFLDRARSMRPGYVVPEDQVGSFVLLLERLDGLPLAIELAAARIKSLTHDQMLGEIDDRFTFLVSRRSDVSPRQRSLRATIDWSFQGLSKEYKEILESLSAFRGGWTLELASKATGRADIIDCLQDLVERSLVHQKETSQGARFTMLETIRDFVIAETSQTRNGVVRRNQAELISDHLYAISRRHTGMEQNLWFEATRSEMDNARAAIEWSVENEPPVAAKLGAGLWRFWCAHGSPREGEHWLERILVTDVPKDSQFVYEAMVGRGVVGRVLGDDHAASTWLLRAAEYGPTFQGPRGGLWPLVNLSLTYYDQGRIQEAYESAIEAQKLCEPSERHPLLVSALSNAMARMGRFEEALELAELAFVQRIGSTNPAEQARAYSMLAQSYTLAGRFEGVLGLLQEGVSRLRQVPIQDFLLDSLVLLAGEQLRLSDFEEFRQSVDEARRISAEVGSQRSMGVLTALEARAQSRSGSIVEAVRLYEGAIRLAGERGSTIDLLEIARKLAADLATHEKPYAATQVLSAELGLRKHIGAGMSKSEFECLSGTLEVIGEVDPALEVKTPAALVAKITVTTTPIR